MSFKLTQNDFRQTRSSFLSAKSQDTYEVGDMVIDESDITGKVKFTTEKYGVFVEYIDGFEQYEKPDALRKLVFKSDSFFAEESRKYGMLVACGRVIRESVLDFFHYAEIDMAKNAVYVRASNIKVITTQFSSRHIGDADNFFQVRMTPLYNVELQQLHIRKSIRGTTQIFKLARDLFIDLSLNLKDKHRYNFYITDDNEYNKEHWLKIQKTFKHLDIDYNENI